MSFFKFLYKLTFFYLYRFKQDLITIPSVMLLPKRHGATGDYRYGFQGQEKDDEIKGEGNSINYKFRMHDPRVGRFFAVDPLTHAYPWYSPYQFSGNKVIQFIEREGLEEDGIYYEFDPYDYGISLDQIVNGFFDGSMNIALITNEWIVADWNEGITIRLALTHLYKAEIPENITNSQLGDMFRLRKRDRQFVIEPDEGLLSDLFDLTLSSLDVAALIPPAKGGGVFMAMKTGPVVKSNLSSILRGLSIQNRAKRISKFLDPDTNKVLRPHEVESASAFEEAIGGTVKQSDIEGVDILASGSFGGTIFANRKISLIGKPIELNQTIEQFTEWLGSLNKHLKHSDVYTLVDIRHFSDERKALIKGLINSKSKEIKEAVIIME